LQERIEQLAGQSMPDDSEQESGQPEDAQEKKSQS
jgi:hypothetical protein